MEELLGHDWEKEHDADLEAAKADKSRGVTVRRPLVLAELTVSRCVLPLAPAELTVPQTTVVEATEDKSSDSSPPRTMDV